MPLFLETQQDPQPQANPFADPLLWMLGALLLVMLFFMFRGNRKRQEQMQKLRAELVPGARVMTSTGIFGTLLWIDDEKLQAGIEIAPGVEMVVHRQVVSQVVTDDAPGEGESAGEPEDIPPMTPREP